MTNNNSHRLTPEEYKKNCYEDVCDIVILHSLSPEELLSLDGPLFPIDFEVWHETERTLSIMESKSYGDLLDPSFAAEIKEYLIEILKLPSNLWNYEEFSHNPFWKSSRIKAEELVKKLGLEERGYWE